MHLRHLAVAAFAAALALLAPVATAAPAAPPSAAEVNAKLGLVKSAVVRLAVDPAGRERREAVVAVEGELLTLDLVPVSLRADGYRVCTVGADGEPRPVTPAPERTYRGEVIGTPGSVVAASVLDEGLFAWVARPGGRAHWIEPIARHFPERDDLAGLHVVYADADVLATAGVCATAARHVAGEATAAPRVAAAGTGEIVEAELACDADFDYFQDYGSTQAVEDRIHAVINQVNVQYERDVRITHRITTILVRTSQVYTSSNANTLIMQFRNQWNANHGGIARDVAHLFTGKILQEDIIGIAFIGVICDLSLAYSVVESDFNGIFACATDLSAHELGHNWDAEHCACPDHTMNPGITCANEFSQQSINTIIAHRDSRNCLEGVGGGGPENDDCADAIAVGDGSTPFDTGGATTDGPMLPAACNEGFGLSFVNDIWYAYTAPCTGTATVSLCGSSFDTRLAVYGDGNCPGSIVACNDDACGTSGLRSETSFEVKSDTVYLVRVGGFNTSGTGTMVIVCDGVIDCPADVDGNRDVGFGDVLRVLGQWGPCEGCPEDVDDSGDAGFSDVLRILADWGPCP